MHGLRQRLRRPLAAAPATLVVLVLAACGSSHGSTPPPSAAVTASGSVAFHASGFSTSIPGGWSDRTNDQAAVDAVGASGAMQMLLIAATAGGSASNEHIDVTTVAQPVPDDQLSSYLQSVAQNGATSVSTPQPFTLDRATGLFVTYNLSATATPPAQSLTLKVQDMLINHGGQTYEIVLNTAQADFGAQLPALQHVLSSWHWSG